MEACLTQLAYDRTRTEKSCPYLGFFVRLIPVLAYKIRC